MRMVGLVRERLRWVEVATIVRVRVSWQGKEQKITTGDPKIHYTCCPKMMIRCISKRKKNEEGACVCGWGCHSQTFCIIAVPGSAALGNGRSLISKQSFGTSFPSAGGRLMRKAAFPKPIAPTGSSVIPPVPPTGAQPPSRPGPCVISQWAKAALDAAFSSDAGAGAGAAAAVAGAAGGSASRRGGRGERERPRRIERGREHGGG